VGLVTALLMAWLAGGPEWQVPSGAIGLSVLLLVLVGLAFDLAGLLAFRASRTTVNPLRPERASSLGMVFLLLAWGVHLAHWPALLLGPAVYMLYLGRFQIAPEERVLLGLFGEEYRAYMARVRRWL
jgi:protein-S-isoprenylcysteine O-methyltransferase Ste14